MKSLLRAAAAPALFLIVAACASAPLVNMKEPRRIVGTENDVRIDAEIVGDQLSPSVRLPIKYDITNNRATAIAVADLIPDTTYDPETLVLTVTLGSEVPGMEFLPRLVVIGPGQKKSFSVNAAVKVAVPGGPSPFMHAPQALRLKLNFLTDPKPFEKLIDIPEKVVHDPQLAAEIFPKWVEGNESVYTNTLPMRWMTAGMTDEPAPEPPRRRRPVP